MGVVPIPLTVSHTSNVPIEVKFSLKPSCKICSNDFNDKDHIPKLLQCGHTFCSSCIKRSVESNKFSYSGDGDVFRHFNCFTCKKESELDTNKSDYGFPSNFQLMEVLQPSDTRSLKCIECHADSNECMMQICRMCTINNFKFDIVKIDHEDSVTDPDNFAICSTCILRKHKDHIYIDFYPIRRFWHLKNVLRDVKVAKASYDKFFCEAREIMDKTPRLLTRFQDETSRMIELMSYAKSSHQLKYMEKRYEEEMKKVVGVAKCIKDSLIKVNGDIEKNCLTLRDENDNLKGTACDENIQNIQEVLKVFGPSAPPEEEEVEVKQEHVPEIIPTPFVLLKNIIELIWLSISWTTQVTLEETKKIIEKQKDSQIRVGYVSIHPKFIIFSFSFTVVLSILAMIFKILFF
ncbi:unnamed protein product [Caenorhabditis angaria]|uniref:RING-type domain-containing protein n=1 Tax=Caenorhabditis angaria TaxID=860376 RepID=A0A9P1IIR0_9PELO|nr:unnamed protein product [Caenorhabditis angaria]